MGLLRPSLRFLEDGDIYSFYHSMIKDAEEIIYLVSPFLGMPDHIKEALLSRSREGIKILILTRHKNSRDVNHNKNIDFILKHLGKKSIYFDKKIHAKILMIDNREMIVSSANFTWKSLIENHEAGIWTDDLTAVKEAKKYIIRLVDKYRKIRE